MFKFFASSSAAMLFAVATPASAASLLFTVTGNDTASFLLDPASPFVTAHIGGTPGFTYDQYHNIIGMFDGVQRSFDFDIYDAASGGGFQIETLDTKLFISPVGPVVFQGTLANPTLVPGTFTFTRDFTRGAIDDKLVISVPGITPAVPEPATWVMMIIGFGVIGFALRRAAKLAGFKFSDKTRRPSDLATI